jgi:anti-sigma factor RsiW
MKCSQIKKKLSAYLDHEMKDDERQMVSGHLKTCTLCQEELAALAKVKETLFVLEGMEVPPYFITRLRQRIKDERSLTTRPVPLIERIRRVACSAAGFAGVAVSLFVGSQMGRTLYQELANDTQTVSVENANTLGFGSFEEFPEGSLSDVYNELITGGNNG